MTVFGPGTSTTVVPGLHRFSVTDVALRHAVRRDLGRLTRVLGDPVTAVRRAALAQHCGYLLDQLQAHHALLDDAIWPAVAGHRAHLADLRERARRAHAEVEDALLHVRVAALTWKRSAGTRHRALSAVRDLAAHLEPVLDQDAELVPLACSLLPAADWADIDRHAPRPSGPTRLAKRLFWLLDDLDPGSAGLLLAGTPRATMWILRNGFSGAYNRGAYLMWVGGGHGPAV